MKTKNVNTSGVKATSITLNTEEEELQNSSVMNTNIKRKDKKEQNKHFTYRECSYVSSQNTKILESEVLSNLSLQKLLFFNTFYSILHFVMLLLIFVQKLLIFKSDIIHILRLILLFAWGFVEWSRLQNAFYGNLKEAFPEMITFLLLSLATLGLSVALAVLPYPFPLETPCLVIEILFNLLEMIVGVYATTRLVTSQTAIFFLRGLQGSSKRSNEDVNREIDEIKRIRKEKERDENDAIGRRKSGAGAYSRLRDQQNIPEHLYNQIRQFYLLFVILLLVLRQFMDMSCLCTSIGISKFCHCLLYTSPSPRDQA
eukprot:TRINITY_DN7922_c0_g2_i8.p1 TRINITY_DN7922_c0_g2~~TRINITY_DN7922_c0_g2_i8.p1  ORF type:complete len:314 (-),score=20.24 TRINITY_DN7922_c0_g2_i8:35-976(-)